MKRLLFGVLWVAVAFAAAGFVGGIMFFATALTAEEIRSFATARIIIAIIFPITAASLSAWGMLPGTRKKVPSEERTTPIH